MRNVDVLPLPPGLARDLRETLIFWSGCKDVRVTNDYGGILLTWRGKEYEIRRVVHRDES